MLTKRQLLQYIGFAAGAAGVYRTMAALGMLGVTSLTGCSSPSAVSQSMGDGKRVVILGAGIAGLVAAYELDKSGYDCTVLEATARAGGRNLTVRRGDVVEEFGGMQRVNFDDKRHLYANMGPARIPYHHRAILDYCKEFDVDLEVFTNDNRAAFFQAPGSLGERAVVARQLHTDQRGYIAELLAKAVNRKALDQELTADDKERLLIMLKDFGDLQDDYMYVDSGRAGYQGEHVHRGLVGDAMPVEPLDLKEALGFGEADLWWALHFSHGVNQNPTLFQPAGGMDRIVEAFKDRVGHLIRYESVVQGIWNRTAGDRQFVRIEFLNRGVDDAVEADLAVCTIPTTVLKDIPNNFSEATRTAIESKKYDAAVKIAFQAKRRFWEEDHDIYGGISWTAYNDIQQIWYPANGYHKAKGIIMGAYIFGEDEFDRDFALEFAKMPHSQRLEHALDSGDRIHRGYRDELEVNTGVSRAWSEVPFQKGSWPSAPVPVEALERPDGVVYFAGDHVSALSGWQEGSAQSAMATVKAINERVLA